MVTLERGVQRCGLMLLGLRNEISTENKKLNILRY